MSATRLVPTLISLLWAPALAAQITLPSTVDDTTFGPLRSGTTYLASNSVTVPAGQTLTVEPGAVIKMAALPGIIGRGFFVEGTLNAVGTALQPIHFTSSEDNSVGLPIGSGAPAPADWFALVFRSGSDQSLLEHAVVRYGGRTNIQTDFGALLVKQSSPTIRHCTISDSSRAGVLLERSARPVIRGCAVTDNADFPFSPTLTWAQLALLSDNTAARNAPGDHIVINIADLDGATRIDRENTTTDVIELRIATRVSAGDSLTLGGGVIVKASARGIRVEAIGGDLFFDGRGDLPVVLTSIKDDSFGGDTNRNGPSVGSPGDWIGVRWDAASDGYANHLRVRYPGSGFLPGVLNESAFVALTSLRVDFARDEGIDVLGLEGVAANWVAFKCGTGINARGGLFDIHHATCTGNTTGVFFGRQYTGSVFNSISYGNTRNFQNVSPGRIFFSNGLAVGPPTHGNLLVDPMWVDPSNGDLHLDPFSLLVGKADLPRATLWGVDHDGNSRILDHALNGLALPDMGAFEVAPFRMDIQGVPRLGTQMDFTVSGQTGFPNAFSLYVLGFGVGGAYVQPFGVLIAGLPTAITPLTVLPIGVTFSMPIANQPAWLGTRFGIQALTVTQLSPPVAGNLCNAFLGSIRN